MNSHSPFGFPPLDPSKMDPKVLMQLSELIRQLPPDQINRMQSIMHNSMAGFDVRHELEEFEKSLPPGFREKMMSIMMGGAQAGAASSGPISADSTPVEPASANTQMSVREARLTILRAVADGQMPPEEAERLLFSAS